MAGKTAGPSARSAAHTSPAWRKSYTSIWTQRWRCLDRRLEDDGRTVAAMDVLAPGIGEIIGGSQREEQPEVLDRSMAEPGIDREHYAPSLTLPRSRGREGWGRPAPLRHGAARRLRPRLRAHPRLRHRPRQCARRHPLPAHPRQRAVLMHPASALMVAFVFPVLRLPMGGKEIFNGCSHPTVHA